MRQIVLCTRLQYTVTPQLYCGAHTLRVYGRSFVFYIVLSLFPALLFAQEGKKDLQAVSEKLRKAHLYYEVEYRISDAKKPGTKPLETSKVTCYSWYPYSVFRYDGAELYHNDRFKLALYEKKKLIIINRADKKVDHDLQKEQFSIDSVMKFCTRIELLKNETHERAYRIYYKAGLQRYAYTDIAFDPTTFLLSHVVLHYSKTMGEMYGKRYDSERQQIKPEVEILFTSYRELGKEDWNTFKAGNILSINNKGNVVMKEPYRKYELANYYNLRLK